VDCSNCYGFLEVVQDCFWEREINKMGKCTVIDEFEGEYKGIPYDGNIFWDTEEHISICKVYPIGIGRYVLIQRDSFKSAIWETERAIDQHIEDSKKKDSKTFILIRIGSETDYSVSEFYQDLEEENLWISCCDEGSSMEEVVDIPGIWNYEDICYVAVETSEDMLNKPIPEELKNLPMEVLKNAQKFVAKRVKEILKKGK
jgi:hypothetical protein